MFLISSLLNFARCVLEPLRRGERALVCSTVGLQLQLLGKFRIPGTGVILRLLSLSVGRSRLARRSAVHLLALLSRGLPLGLTTRCATLVASPVGSLVALGVHVIFEGKRWQLFPVYAATGAVAIAGSGKQEGFRRAVGWGSLFLTASSTVLNTAFPWFSIPATTGRFRVGRLTQMVVDPSRKGWVTDDKPGPRRLMIDIWYPAVENAKGMPSPYMDKLIAVSLCESFLGPRFGWIASHFPKVSTHSVVGAAPTEGRFPIVLFSHGNVSTRVQNTSLMEELASHGFVCVACDHPHDAAIVNFPTGEVAEFEWEVPAGLSPKGVLEFRTKQVEMRADDLSFLLDTLRAWDSSPGHRFEGRLDCDRAAAVGHSFGGAAACATVQRDLRFRAAVLMDAWMWPLAGKYVDSGAPCPMLLWESAEFLCDRDAFTAFNSQISSMLTLRSRCAYKVVSQVAGHYEYTDMALCAPRFLQAVGLVNLSPQEVVKFQVYQSHLILDFLNAHVQLSDPASGATAAASAPAASALSLPAIAVSPSPAPWGDDEPCDACGGGGGGEAEADSQKHAHARARRWSFGAVTEPFLGAPDVDAVLDSAASFWGPSSCRAPGPISLITNRGTDDGCLETSPGGTPMQGSTARAARRRREREQMQMHREHVRGQLLRAEEPRPPALPMSPKRLKSFDWFTGVAGALREPHNTVVQPTESCRADRGGAGDDVADSPRARAHQSASGVTAWLRFQSQPSHGGQTVSPSPLKPSPLKPAPLTPHEAQITAAPGCSSHSSSTYLSAEAGSDAGADADADAGEGSLICDRGYTRGLGLGGKELSFARGSSTSVGAESCLSGSQAPVAGAWEAPEDTRFAKSMSALEMAEQASSLAWTPKQRAAMRLLVQQVRLGEYESLGLKRDVGDKLPEVLVEVIHYRSLESIRAIVREAEEELKAASPAPPPQQQQQSAEEKYVVVSQ